MAVDRYRVGWDHPAVKSAFTNACPAYASPVIDVESGNALGVVVCVCPDRSTAVRVTEALNRASKEKL